MRQAFSEALRIDKKLRDQEMLRSKKSIPPRSPIRYGQQGSSLQKPNPAPQAPTKPNFAPQRAANIQFNNPGAKTFYCSHCKVSGHSDSRCFILHSELKKNFTQRQHMAETPPEEETLETYESETESCETEQPYTLPESDNAYHTSISW